MSWTDGHATNRNEHGLKIISDNRKECGNRMWQHGGNLHATILTNQPTTKCMQRDDDDVHNDNNDDGSVMVQKVVR